MPIILSSLGRGAATLASGWSLLDVTIHQHITHQTLIKIKSFPTASTIITMTNEPPTIHVSLDTNRDAGGERRCHPYRGNKEALGWALDGVARLAIFSSAAVFVSTALINLAKKSVGCLTEAPEGETSIPECDAKIYGLRPSSILTTYG